MIIKSDRIKLGSISLEVIRKDIRNVHLSVYPPTGRVRIAAPMRMKLETVRVFAISKLGWIKKQQNRFRNQKRETAREYLTRESHYYFGKRFLLKVIECNCAPTVKIKHNILEMYVRPDASKSKKKEVLDQWYRERLKEQVPEIISKYEKALKVSVASFGIKKMRTKWGTCNSEAKRIWLNLELVKKPLHYVEYITLHEMVHLIERRHNSIFTAYLNKIMPQWKSYKEELNRAPLGHVNWDY
ncbi:MAG: hypothetical protein A4E71_00533 [Smithella sp. PtaU1.Bin162]|nr:MAG: hypothetical protein A4E71_00533 [Smithella sp. PtaU1.Bin162]